jgi:hypothetical protein
VKETCRNENKGAYHIQGTTDETQYVRHEVENRWR